MVFFIALTVAGLFIIRRRDFDGYKTPFFPLTAIIFLGLTGMVLLLIFLKNPLQAILGGAVVILGLPIYYWFFRQKGNLKDGLD